MRKTGILFLIICTIGGLSFLLEACHKKERVFRGTPVSLAAPPYFPPPVYPFGAAPFTKETIELGRHLFYEGRLSKDGNYPCSSCHQQEAAFTTFAHDLSHGYNNSHTTRNAPALFNLAWQNEFRHDGSAKTIEAVALAHITHPNEMGETMEGVLDKLKRDNKYRQLFAAAYGDEAISSERLLLALAHFVVSIVSANSRYDKVKKGEAAFTPVEKNGYEVYKAACAYCHAEPLFTDFSYRNIGLELDPFFRDIGRMLVTRQAADSLKFRVPSLRNTELTSHYTHDGRIGLLKGMVLHYRNGVKPGPTLDPLLHGGIPLSNAQIDELVAFLKTLSDSSLLINPQLNRPQ